MHFCALICTPFKGFQPVLQNDLGSCSVRDGRGEGEGERSRKQRRCQEGRAAESGELSGQAGGREEDGGEGQKSAAQCKLAGISVKAHD